MSELSEYVGCLVPVGKLALANVIRRVQSLLPAHDVETREQARQEQMEVDCKVRCVLCLRSTPLLPVIPGADCAHQTSRFGWEPCEAKDIRAAFAKAHRESWTKEAEHAE